jgi:hypothetical protein
VAAANAPGAAACISRRTPRPWHARLHSLLTHAVFGLGLYLAGLLYSILRQEKA